MHLICPASHTLMHHRIKLKRLLWLPSKLMPLNLKVIGQQVPNSKLLGRGKTVIKTCSWPCYIHNYIYSAYLEEKPHFPLPLYHALTLFHFPFELLKYFYISSTY